MLNRDHQDHLETYRRLTHRNIIRILIMKLLKTRLFAYVTWSLGQAGQ